LFWKVNPLPGECERFPETGSKFTAGRCRAAFATHSLLLLLLASALQEAIPSLEPLQHQPYSDQCVLSCVASLLWSATSVSLPDICQSACPIPRLELRLEPSGPHPEEKPAGINRAVLQQPKQGRSKPSGYSEEGLKKKKSPLT